MLETDPSFRPARAGEGYPSLEDLGLIGDGPTSGVTPARVLAASGGKASTAGVPA